MSRFLLRPLALVLSIVILSCGWIPQPAGAEPDSARQLAGLWRAHKRFGPRLHGTLTITRDQDGWHAAIGPHEVRAAEKEGAITFEITGGLARFDGRIYPEQNRIEGHWIQAATVHSGQPYASPVVARADGKDRWRGEVIPFEDEFTFFLDARIREDGSLGAWLGNPERNLGVFMNGDRLELEGDQVRLVGSFRRSSDERVLAEGTYHAERDRLSIYFASRGGTYDFERVEQDDAAASGFFARGARPVAYRYRRPSAERDGWAVGSLAEAGISLGPIAELIEKEILPPAGSVNTLSIHGLLIARHGKLVFEEYFHGFHRGKTHDTRSASKSVTSILAGAVAWSEPSFGVSSSVYDVLPSDEPAAELDPRKRRMTVRHLLTMSSGLACDDADLSSPGNEETLQEQEEEPDWYRFTSRLPMVREPGEAAAYCSGTTNLLGSVLATASGQPLPRLLHERLARPLQIERYHLFLTPSGNAYMGGGIHWLPRDFLKFGQLMLNGGTWNGRRILSEGWAADSVAKQTEIGGAAYGYLWWLHDLPYKDRTVSAFFAGGNGGQMVLGVPELDLLIGFFAGNYSDRIPSRRIQRELVPQYILPAVDAVSE